MKIVGRGLLLAAVAAMVACGGGGGGGATVGDPGGAVAPVATAASRIQTALSHGDPSGLKVEDSGALLDQAITEAKRQQQVLGAALATIYGDAVAAPDLSLNFTNNSTSIGLMSSSATSLLVSDGGTGMAALSVGGAGAAQGRALAYGADVLGWMAGTDREQQHYPQFLRAFKWLMTGRGDGTLPAQINFATAGYAGGNVRTFLKRAGVTGTALSCAIADSANLCWKDADILVFGSSTDAGSGLTPLVQKYRAAGKPVIYLHPNWIPSTSGTQVLRALGMTMGGQTGNYYAKGADVSIAATRTVDASLLAGDRLTPLVASLELLRQVNPGANLTADIAPLAPFSRMLAELGAVQMSSFDIFVGDGDYLLQRLLVLWADLQRPSISYGKLSRKDTAAFLRTYATDAFIWMARPFGTVAKAGQGDYMTAQAQAIQPSTDWEELPITLPQPSGITLIGRGALPGRTALIEVVDATGVGSLGVQTSYLRTWGDPATDAGDTYSRPLRPNSFNFPINNGGVTLTSPNGGPLMLSYSGATAGTVIKLRVKGVTPYAHFDYVTGMSDAALAQASAALVAGSYGWQSIKVVGGEIQQTIGNAKQAIGTKTPEYYANTMIRDGLFMSNHLANGYNDAGNSATVTALCAKFGWVCDGPVHNPPLVQHFVGWISTCGFLCSGNPIDGYAPIGLGWGYAHEMGHNTVQRVMHITPDGIHGCVVECDNNILASATALRAHDKFGLEISSGHPLDNPGLYAAILANRATGLTGAALVADQEARIWSNSSQDVMRAVHFQLAFLFTKERCGLDMPTVACTLDFFNLLTKADRLVSKSFNASSAASLGMGRFAKNSISNHDLLYVLSSKIIGQDLRRVFGMYGIPLSDSALGSIEDLALPAAPRRFYALAAGKHNALAMGQWMDIEAGSPAWPY